MARVLYSLILAFHFVALLSANEIVCIGNSIVDYTFFVSEELLTHYGVTKGGTQQIADANFDAMIAAISHATNTTAIIKTGGSAGILAKGLGQLGCDIAFWSRYADDANGCFFQQTLASNGVIVRGKTSPGKTARIICLVTPDAQRSFLFCVGTNGVLAENDLVDGIFENARIIHCEGYILRQAPLFTKIIQMAKAHHAKLSFDLGNFMVVQDNRTYILDTVLPNIDILIGNLDEMRALFGDDESIHAHLAALPCLSIIMQGADGCTMCADHNVLHFPTRPVRPCDTTGAGDTFTSGLLYGILHHWPLDRCAALANRLGGEVITHVGGEMPVTTWEAIKAEYAECCE